MKLVYEQIDGVTHKHRITLMNAFTYQLEDMIPWCIDMFGEDRKRLAITSRVFYFRDEKDATWFLLRWS